MEDTKMIKGFAQKGRKQFRIWAGEGTGNGNIEGYAATLRGARRMATIASCSGDRWTKFEENLDGQKNSMGQELIGWMEVEK